MKKIAYIALVIILFAANFAVSQDEGTQTLINNSNVNLTFRNFRDYKVYDINVFEDAKIKAISMNDAEIMYNIACMYRDGVGTKKDYRQAKAWFDKASSLNHDESKVELAKILSFKKEQTGVKQNIEKAEELVTEAIKSEKGSVYYKIGYMYEKGILFDKDIKQAVKLYNLAAKKKYNKAYLKLFNMYENGKGVKRSEAKAMNWLILIQKLHTDKKARDFATYTLSEKYYAMGKNLPEISDKQKYVLFNLSWDNGKPEAADMIAECLSRGIGVKRDCDLAKKWYEMSIREFESVNAMEKLGTMLMDADCGNYKRDFKQAAKYFENAATLGGAYGAYMLGYIYQNGVGRERDEYQAKTWFDRSEILKKRPMYSKRKRRKFSESEKVI